MRRTGLCTLLFCVLSFFAQAQEPIQLRENFFNRLKYYSQGKEISSAEVSEMLVSYAQEKRDFDEGLEQMKTGSALRIFAFETLTAGLGILFANADNPNA